VLNSPAPASNGIYQVNSVSAPNSFSVSPPAAPAITTGSQGSNSVTVYPLKGSQWVRSGTVTVDPSTWAVGYTLGTTATALNQTPLNSTTVFNFFQPDYQYPGEMARAGMTTPEFQLTNDSNTMNLTNVISQISPASGNPNGYSSFFNGNAVTVDLGPYMTPGQTGNANIATLVNTLAVLLTGDNLSAPVRTTITDFVANTTNFPYTSPTPSTTQMRDRVRAVVHLILTSAEYAIQR